MIRILLYAVVFYFIYRLLDSIFRPKRASANAGGTTRAPRGSKQKVTIQYDRDKAKSKVGDDVGEYVDFEEIKEEDKPNK
jgi:hypothetical protein